MKSWMVTPAFCKAKMLEQFLEHVYKTPPKDFEHVICGNHYPVDKEANHAEIQRLARKFGCTYVDSGADLGLHRSINKAMEIVGVKVEDIYCGADPDDRPSPGAFEAMREVMLADPTIGVLGLMFWVIPWKMRDHGLLMEKKIIAGHTVLVHPGLEMWNVASFNMQLIHGMGGFHQPNAYYGGIEVALWPHMVQRGMRLAYLVDHTSEAAPVNREDPLLYDKTYGQWKIDHATRGYAKSFEEWLNDLESSRNSNHPSGSVV